MASPKVTLAEIDQSTRVPTFSGVTGAIVIPAKKGPVNDPVLVTNETQFLQNFTPDDTVKVGYDTSHYSAVTFLGDSNRLYVVRAANSPLFGGYVLTSEGATQEPFAMPIGYEDIDDYDFGASASAWQASTSYQVGDKVIPTSGNENGYYFHATSGGVSGSAEPTWSATIGDTVTDGSVTWTVEGTTDEDAMLIYGANPGAWNNDISITVANYANSQDEVKVTDSALVTVFRNGDEEETHTVSRVEDKKNGYNQNIFAETALESSLFIRALVNSAISETTQPGEVETASSLTSGSDGSSVTDTQMQNAADTLSSPNDVDITVFMDGGWATTAYHTKVNTICSSRQDCVGILSVPFSDEDTASTYISEITDYRNTELNLNSSWSALYTGWLKIRDKYNDRDLWVSPDGAMGAVIARTTRSFEIWLAPAGLDDRARISAKDVRRHYTEGEMDTLYDNEVNPISFSVGRGIRPWGQKTLLTQPSSLDRLNVRLLMIAIGPQIKTSMESFLFKQNNATTRAQAASRISDFLRSIEARGGITQFRVQVDDENNSASDIANNIMNVWVFITPTTAVETIPIKVILTNPGADLELAA